MAPAPAPAKRFAGALAALPEDVLLEVFSRVRSVKDLLLFAVTSRWWLRLFTDPAFLRGLLPAHGQGHGARLLGFFFQQTRFVRCERMMKARMTVPNPALAPTFFPAPGSPLGPTDCALTAFVSDDDGAFNYADPVASRCGIILMRLVPRSMDFDALSNTGLLFGLCNPATGERHIAPPVEGTSYGCNVAGYAIVTAADNDLDGEQRPLISRRHEFTQLLLISSHKDNGDLHLHSYCAATRVWSEPSVCLTHRERLASREQARSATVLRGAVHWLYDSVTTMAEKELYTLSVEMATMRVSFTKIPVTYGQTPFLCVSGEGKLTITSVYGAHVQVWTQQDAGDGDRTSATWLRTRLIQIPIAVLSQRPHAMLKRREWFEFNGGAMLVLFEDGDVFILDLEKKVVEKLMDCPRRPFDRRCGSIVPYEMDISEFFVFQLGCVARASREVTY